MILMYRGKNAIEVREPAGALSKKGFWTLLGHLQSLLRFECFELPRVTCITYFLISRDRRMALMIPESLCQVCDFQNDLYSYRGRNCASIQANVGAVLFLL